MVGHCPGFNIINVCTDFAADKFVSGVKFVGLEGVKQEATIYTVLPDFSRSKSQGEKLSSTTVLTTSFDDDVKKYSVFGVPQDEAEFKSICRRSIHSGNTLCINSR